MKAADAVRQRTEKTRASSGAFVYSPMEAVIFAFHHFVVFSNALAAVIQ
jgi:hypothetical protein